MSIVKKRLAIEGMSCVHCQEKIERTLKNTAGIESAEVRYAQGRADVAYDPEAIALERIREIVGELGYRVLPEGATGFGRRIALLAAIALLYILLQELGVLNLLVPSQLADTEMGYGMLFVIGLMTSVHCVAMCGGINLSQCIPRGTDGQARPGRSALRPALLYNLGRVLSYTAIGFLLGLVGRLIGGGSGAGIPVMLQGVLKLAAGALMVVMGVNMLGLFPPLRRLTLRLPGRLALLVGERRSREGRPLFVGLFNGLMPCGPLQSMQVVALASASPWAGALSMLLFSLGTVPLMLGLGSLVSALGRRFSRGVMAVGAVLVVVLGLAMLSQGGSLSGLLLPDRLMAIVVALCVLGAVASLPFPGRLYRSLGLLAAVAVLCGGFVLCGRLTDGAEPGAAAQTVQQDGVQVVNSTLSAGRYPDITVQAGIPVRWVIDAPAGTINGCNYKMLVSAYGIEHVFTEGENVIEFTPQEAGTVPYTCWMGMIRGNIFVTDGSGSSSGQPSTEGVYGASNPDVPVPSGYRIPTDTLAVAQIVTDEDGQPEQQVSIALTEEGFSPAVVVVQAGTPVLWGIDNGLEDAASGTLILVPAYAARLELGPGENSIYLYPDQSFEISTGDHRFYAYVKVVEDVARLDEEAIREEAGSFETLIYPDAVFVSAGASCCG